MATRAELLTEAYKRGLLPADKKAAYEEAVRRGLIGKQVQAQTSQQQVEPQAEPQVAQQQEQGFFQRTAEDLRQRGANLANTFERQSTGQQTAAETGLQVVGTQIGAVGDIAGQALAQTADFPIATLGGSSLADVGSAISRVIPDAAKEKIGSAIGTGAQKYREFAKENPRAAANLEATGNIAAAFTPIKGNSLVKLGAKGAAGGREAVKNVSEAVTKETINALAPTLDDTTKALASKAVEFNIPLSINQIAPSRFKNTVQKVSQEIPLSGVNAFEDTQRQAFTKAVAKTIGQDSADLSPETIKSFRKDVGEKFNTVLGGKAMPIGADDITQISAIKEAARDSLETGAADLVDRNVNKALKSLVDETKDGFISGEKLASLRSEMVKTSTRVQGGASEFIGDIVESIDNLALKNLSAKDAEQLQTARRQWRNFRTIQPLLEKSTDGQINPTDLMQKVASSRFITASERAIGEDDLVDLARVGKQFLVKQGGSDTFQKGAVTGGAGILGLSAFASPVTAAQTGALAGGVMLGNRMLQGINRNQDIISAAIKKK